MADERTWLEVVETPLGNEPRKLAGHSRLLLPFRWHLSCEIRDRGLKLMI